MYWVGVYEDVADCGACWWFDVAGFAGHRVCGVGMGWEFGTVAGALLLPDSACLSVVYVAVLGCVGYVSVAADCGGESSAV